MQFKGVDVFELLISLINFALMFILFNQVVILPMIDAVRVRRLRVQNKLDEIAKVLEEARATEATYKAQFEKLPQEKEELKAAAEREIARTKERMTKEFASDAEHLVGKAEAEADKQRRDALANLREQLSHEALKRAEALLVKVFDKDAKANMAENILTKVGQTGAA